MEPKKYPNVTLRLDPEVHAWIVGLAEAEKMSAGQYVKRAMERSYSRAQEQFSPAGALFGMAEPSDAEMAHSQKTVFRGGHTSTGKAVDLVPPPKGPAPGGKPACRHWRRTVVDGRSICQSCGKIV